MCTLNHNTFLKNYRWDMLLGSIVTFYVIMVPYTKVEESFNVQAIHDILYHVLNLNKYDHLKFPGVVPRSFIGAFVISMITSPIAVVFRVLGMSKMCCFVAARLVLGGGLLVTLRFLRIEIRRMFGYNVEGFYAVLMSVQFHLLFYCSRPLPNVLALGLVNLAYGFWLKERYYETLKCLVIAGVLFRCDMVLLLGPVGLVLLLGKFVSFWKAVKCCVGTGILCVGLTVVVDSVMWGYIVWPELSVLWFNSVLNRSSEWGTQAFHWYFTSALPRSLLAAYPLAILGVLLDRRIRVYLLPVFAFVLVYSMLPHKELRFIIGAIPMFNLSAAVAANRIYNNRSKSVWRWLNVMLIGSLLASLGCSFIMFMASYHNYPGGYALKALHQMAKETIGTAHQLVHIDTYSAMSGVSRFSEHGFPWKYSKEEGIKVEEFSHRNFTALLNEHVRIDGYKCLSAISGFSRVRLQKGFPPLLILKKPKVFIHGNIREEFIMHLNWPGCG